MNRKVFLSISALLIVVDIGVTAAVLSSGQRRLAVALEGAAAIAALLRDFTRPIPRLGG